jgi:hypothetical protein
MAHPLGEQPLDVVARSAKVADHSVVRWWVCCKLREIPSRAVTDSLVEALLAAQRWTTEWSTTLLAPGFGG